MKLPEREISTLHNHSEYSLLDGVLNATEFIKAAKKKGIKTLALTEHGNMSSAISYYIEAIKPENNIKPIFGLESYVVDDVRIKDKDAGKSSHLILLAKNEEGYKNLLKISHFSWTDGFYYRPKIDLEYLEKTSKGIVALTACQGGLVSTGLRFKGEAGGRNRVKQLIEIFGKKDLYLEMQMMEDVYLPDLSRVLHKINKIKDEEKKAASLELFEKNKEKYVDLLERNLEMKMRIPDDYYDLMYPLLGDSWMDQCITNKFMYKFSKEFDVPYIMTNDAHYPEKGQHKLQDLIIRVGFGNYRKATGGENERSKSEGRGYYSDQLYLKNNKDFNRSRKKWHPYMPLSVLSKAIISTHEVDDKCDVKLKIGEHKLPTYPIETHLLYQKGDTKVSLFNRLIENGFKEIIKPRIKKEQYKEYRERLEYEKGVIEQAHFIDYFLIVEDIVRWAKANAIDGVARGSVAGSMVGYALGITGIDPIEYYLLFERFLNPTRVSGERAKSADALPDIDLDFEQRYRNRIKRYITDKYGKDHVCTIGSYGTMGVKMLLKDFSRALDYKIGKNQYSYEEINKITSEKTDNTVKVVKTIEDACEANSKFAEFYEENKGWFETYIRPMQAEIKSNGRHAAGILITPTPFTEWIPTRTQAIEDEEGNTRVVVSQPEDIYCERLGLLKLDILGVKQLDVFHQAKDFIKKRHNLEVDVDIIDVKDQVVFQKFCDGDTYGVFQFNSNLQRNYMQRLKPSSIEDLCIANAILRPGPMQVDAHNTMIDLREEKIEPEYDHECVIPFLRQTRGLMIYQEQVMQVAHALGGLSLAEADIMRSAIKKFDKVKMQQFQEKFVDGCKKKKLTQEHADKVWEKMVAFSGYGFNKSHSATYALHGYFCQWLKTYFPVEFYAATMQFASTDPKKDENIWSHRKHAAEDGIKFAKPSINRGMDGFDINKRNEICWPLIAIKGMGDKAAAEIKRNVPYNSFQDFYDKVQKRQINKRKMHSLICAGAFSQYGSQQDIMKEYYKLRKEPIPEEYCDLKKIHWQKIQDDTLGFVSRSYKEMYSKKFGEEVMNQEKFDQLQIGRDAYIGGVVASIREFEAKNGVMAFLTIEDKDEKYNVIIWNSFWDVVEKKPRKGNIVEIFGTKGRSPRGELQVALGNPKTCLLKIIA